MGGATNIGKVRKNNQDYIYFDEDQGIVIVADGIGGRKAGAIASKMAVEGIQRAFVKSSYIQHEEITPFILSAIEKVNNEIINISTTQEDKAGMGTTLNFLIFGDNKLHIAHVGDSRTYLYYQNNLWQLTVDHNVQTYLERGWMNANNISNTIKKEALVKSLGQPKGEEVDIYEIELKDKEIFLTCSDGLTSMVKDKRILEIISQNIKNFNQIPKLLIDEANKNGGKDNISVVLSMIYDG